MRASALSSCDHLCLLLYGEVRRHPRLTHGLLHPFLALDELRNLIFLVVHRFQEGRVELVLLLHLSLVRLDTQV